MEHFGKLYTKYYNLLYKDKDYLMEYAYIKKLIDKYGTNGKNILDIGCGTGKHLFHFKKNGFVVSGIDASKNMITEAKNYLQQNINLLFCNASEFKFNKRFDTIISLFHVMNYLTENDELERVFQNISKHLKRNGLFIFDFWYGPAVLTDLPVVRIKKLTDNDLHITRITEPVMNFNQNIAVIDFEIIIEDIKTKLIERIYETHSMRYLFLPEIDHLAKKNNLKILAAYKWLTEENLSNTSWYGLIVLKKGN